MSQFLVLVCVFVPLGLLNIVLLRFYAARNGGDTGGSWRRLLTRWDFSPESLGGFTYGKLALVSALSLFLELLMIRWVSSEVRVFAYFKNFVLVACFLGFGVGAYLCRRRATLLATVTPLVAIAALIECPWPALRTLITRLPDYIGAFSDVAIWYAPHMGFSWASASRLAAAAGITAALFTLIAFIFIPLGQLVGWYLENTHRGIRGYTVNILASLAGIAFYTLLCFLDQPPAVWLIAAGVMLSVLVWRNPALRWTSVAAFGLCAALAFLPSASSGTTYWSPYQKLTLAPETLPGTGELVGYSLQTNGTWYQHVVDLSPTFVARHPALFPPGTADWEGYSLPYHFYPQPPAVLVLGAGMGNDAASALRHGAGHVVAVEIDPLILALGRRLHFEKPYSSPKVSVVVDDARSYMQNSSEQFDLIVFSLLDSHTTSSSYSNIRIDNYVYTLEAMRAARRLLKPQGLFVVKFAVPTPFIGGRLQGLLTDVFGSPPLRMFAAKPLYGTSGHFFITGSGERIQRALADTAVAAYYGTHSFNTTTAQVTTDDWPYFYQRLPGLPASVVLISILLLITGWWFLREAGVPVSSLRWHFFFLGAGFMLLEAQIISKMALLFGTTWVVNSIVISGLLLLIVGANLLVEWKPAFPIEVAFGGILASILLAYTIPVERFLFASVWLKVLTATAVLCLPVFFAGIVFIKSFARAGFSGTALGSNLFGALVGGVLESLSMWTGLRSLLILAGAFYLASWISLRAAAPATATHPAVQPVPVPNEP
jgi:spermidine synthase